MQIPESLESMWMMTQILENSYILLSIQQVGLPNVRGRPVISLDTWTHVAMTCDGTTAKGYINGAQDGADLGRYRKDRS